MSAGGLNPLEGEHIPGALSEFALRSFRLHLDLWEELAERSDVGFCARIVPWIRIALTEADLPDLDSSFRAFDDAEGFSSTRLDARSLLEMEPRISPEVIAGVYLWGNAAVDSYALTMALMTAAEAMGTTFVRSEVTGLRAEAGSVEVDAGFRTLRAGAAVVAAGPWTTNVLSRVGVHVPVRPLKGEILRLDPPGPMFRHDIAYPGGEAHPKPDGLVWVGATVSEAGFDTLTTDAARETLMADATRAIPVLAKSTVAVQTACLRPVSPDGLPVIGRVPGQDDVYVVSGAGKKGILLGPAMGRAISDLVMSGRTELPVDEFTPDRFAKPRARRTRRTSLR